MKPVVFIVINDLLVGGAQRLIIDQLTYADRERFEWHLVTLFEFPDRKDFYHLVPADIPVHRLHFRGGYDITGWRRFASLLRTLKPTTIFSHLFFSNTITRVLSPFFSYRVYTVEHNTYTNKRPWHIRVDRLLARSSQQVIAVSEEVRTFTIQQQHLPPDKILVIPNGLDRAPLERYQQQTSQGQARQQLNVDPAAVILLSVGRLTPQKGQRLLLEGFAAHLTTCPPETASKLQLWIAGEGELKSSLLAFVEAQGLQAQVRILGAQRDMFPYYRAADALFSTSYIEGLSMAYLEALTFGLPLIATKTGGTQVLLQENVNGFVIADWNVEAIGNALTRWQRADQPSLAAAAQSTASRFDIRENIARYQALMTSDSVR